MSSRRPSPSLAAASQQCSSIVSCIRFRPLGNSSRNPALHYNVSEDGTLLKVLLPVASFIPVDQQADQRLYHFSKVWDTDTSQQEIFEFLYPSIQTNLFQGYNATVMCYGQTGSGKTYTTSADGLVQRICAAVFETLPAVRAARPGATLRASVSFVELYREAVYDLLLPPHLHHCYQGHQGGRYAGNKKTLFKGHMYRRIPVSSYEEVLAAFHEGNRIRRTAVHKMNSATSRSHSVFFLHLSYCGDSAEPPRSGSGSNCWESKLTIVDLAGSERVAKTLSTGQTFQEAVAINSSLSALAEVIGTLARREYVSYRRNLLTMFLKDSFVNSFFALIGCCSSERSNADETVNTLNFCSVASRVTVSRVCNVQQQPPTPPPPQNTSQPREPSIDDLSVWELPMNCGELRRQLATYQRRCTDC
eukprot:RCo012581